MAVDVHPTTLNQQAADFAEGPQFSSNEMALDPNIYNQVFKLGINDGEGYLLGRGTTRNPLQAEGFLAGRLMDNTATTAVQIEDGSWRLTVRTKNSNRLVTVLDEGSLSEIDSRDDSGNKVARKDRKPFPRTDDSFTTKQYAIWFEVQPSSATTVDTAPDSGNTELFVEGYQVEQTA